MGRHKRFEETEVCLKAMDTFWERGYNATAVTDLCQSMGLNPGSLYATFGSKDGLFLAAVKSYLNKVNTEGVEMIDASSDGLAGIRQYFDDVAEGILTGQRRFGCFGTNSLMELGTRDAHIRELMLEHLEELQNTFADALHRSGIADPHGRAAFLICVAQGLNVLARTNPTRVALGSIIQNTFDTLAPTRPVS